MQSSLQSASEQPSSILTSLADRRSTDRHRPRQSNDMHAWYHERMRRLCLINDSHRRHNPSIIYDRQTAVAIGYRPSYAERRDWLEVSS